MVDYIIVALVALLHIPNAICLGGKNDLDEKLRVLDFSTVCSQYTKRKSSLLFPSLSLASVSVW